MKTRILTTGSLALILAALPLVSGCNSQATEVAAATNTLAPAADNTDTDALDEDDTTDGEPMPAPPADLAEKSVPTDIQLTSGAAEIAKLAQSGVSEAIMLSYVNNSAAGFNLGSQQIIYLNDLGVPETVINGMIQRDQALKGSASLTPSTPPPAPAPAPADVDNEAPEPDTNVADVPPTAAPADPTVVNYNYFYDSLSPYGAWVNLPNYGWCWQPTVVAGNRGWQPYCDRGRWVYTDSGWYWHSDYSWGAVAFHYGRWFNDSRYGWCWYPQRTWGPAWVAWRSDDSYCGWAPLSPAARFSYGVGVTYGNGFSFSAGWFTFVPWGSFCDPHPYRYRVPQDRLVVVYNGTRPTGNIVGDSRHRVFNRGIAPDRVAAITHQTVPRYNLRDNRNVRPNGNPGERFNNANHTIVVNRPVINPRAQVTPVNRNRPGNQSNNQNQQHEVNRPVNVNAQPTTVNPVTPPRRANPVYEHRPQHDNTVNNQGTRFNDQPGRSPTVTSVTPAPVTTVQPPRQANPAPNNPVTVIGRQPPENPRPNVVPNVPAVRNDSPRPMAPYTPPAQANQSTAPIHRVEPRPTYIPPVRASTPAPSYSAPVRPPTPAPAPSYSAPVRTYTPPAPQAPRNENRAPAYSAPAPAPRPSLAPARNPDAGSQNRGHDDRKDH